MRARSLPRRSRLIARSIAMIAAVAVPLRAHAQNVTGSWKGTSVAGGATYQNTFSFVQKGTQVIGSAIAGTAPGVITGSIAGTQITFHSVYADINYSSDAVATTDGSTMSGTFLDSQGTSGTFSATKQGLVLAPALILDDPPIVRVNGRTVTFTLVNLVKLRADALRANKSSAGPATSVEYDVRVKGAAAIRRQTKKNTLTLKNLKPGSYTATYRVSGFRNGKKLFTTKPSPAAKFTVS